MVPTLVVDPAYRTVEIIDPLKGAIKKCFSSCISKFPQYIKNVRVKKKTPLDDLPEVNREIKRMNEKMKKEGRVLVRYSGTESLLRIMVESKNEIDIDDFTKPLIDKLEKENNGK